MNTKIVFILYIIYLFYNNIECFKIIDNTLPHNNNYYAQNIDSCRFSYRFSIEAETGDPVITSVTVSTLNPITEITDPVINETESDATRYLFDLFISFPIDNNDVVSEKISEVTFLISDVKELTISLGYECESIPYPLINTGNDREFQYIDNHYLVVFNLNLKREIIDYDSLITYSLEDTFACYLDSSGYSVFSFSCSIIGWNNIEAEFISITITDLQGRSTIFSFPTFIDFKTTLNPIVTLSEYNDITSSQLYSFINFKNYPNQYFFLSFIPEFGYISYRYISTGSVNDYNYFFSRDKDAGTVSQVIVEYLKGSTQQSLTGGNYTTNSTVIPIVNTISLNSLIYIQNVEITLEILDMNELEFKISFGYRGYFIKFNYPLGVVGMNNSNLIMKLTTYTPNYQSYFMVTDINQTFMEQQINIGSYEDFSYPSLLNIEFIKIDITSTLVRIHASDIGSGIASIYVGDVKLYASDIVQGDIYDGIYEKLINVSETDYDIVYSDTFVVLILDQSGAYYEYDTGVYDFQSIPLFPDVLYPQKYYMEYHKIKFLRYAMNDIDLSILDCNNTLYVLFDNIDNIDKDELIKLTLFIEPEVLSFYGGWNEVEQMFSVDFRLPNRLLNGYISVDIGFTMLSTESSLFPRDWQLKVRSDFVDRMPPLIIDIISHTSNPGGRITWDFIIEDEYNGFKNGTILVLSNVNQYVPYEFIITPNSTQNIYLDTYTIGIDLPIDCFANSFYIKEIKLFDNNDLKSFSGTETNPLSSKITPFLKLLNSSKMEELTIEVNCPNKTDTTPPIITSIEVIASNPNLFSSNREFIVNFTVTDTESPISTSHYPSCYLYPLLSQPIESKSTLQSINNTEFSAIYSCLFQIEYGFGYPGGDLLLSINGISDDKLNIGGYSPIDLILQLSFNSSIPTHFEKQPIISNSNTISMEESKLTIFGYGFGINNETMFVRIDYQDQNSENRSTIFQSDRLIVIDGIKQNQTSFNITVINEIQSNTYMVHPYEIIRPNPKPPIFCTGNPVCGGTERGECTYYGCVCKYPWTGNDCLSQIVIISPPTINTTNPDINSNYTFELPNGEIVTLSSFIKIESIRELTFNGSEVLNHRFTSWIFTNTTSPYSISNFQEYTYSTTILSHNSRITKIKVTIQYYMNLTTIYFANEKIQMLPSTLKYRIELSPYGFKANNNQLQIIMSTSFSSSYDDSCSYQDSGDIINSNLEYLRLQINDNSLYCRFIKKGVVDNRIQNISNTLFPIDSIQQSSTHISRNIGINIPYYIANALVDPDFAILSDLLPAGDNDDAICDYIDEDDGLTKVQLIGIIIACVIFVLLILFTIFLYKLKTNLEFRVKFYRKIETHIRMKILNKL